MKPSRREFLTTSFWAAIFAFFLNRVSWAADAVAGKFRSPPPANAADPTKPGPAMAQKYTHFAAQYAGPKKPTFTAESKCHTCNFFKPDKPSDAWGKCAMVGSKYVYEEGLCQAWSKKPGT
jgi:hypothetical protein